MRFSWITVTIGSVALLSGCASIVDGKNQVVSVDSRNGEEAVAGASCKLVNDKGAWFVVTPGTTTVQRSYQDLNIECQKDGLAPTVMTIKSSTKGLAFGNVIFGGLIGAGLDMATGAAYDYPSPITIQMSDLIDPAKLSKLEVITTPETPEGGTADAKAD